MADHFFQLPGIFGIRRPFFLYSSRCVGVKLSKTIRVGSRNLFISTPGPNCLVTIVCTCSGVSVAISLGEPIAHQEGGSICKSILLEESVLSRLKSPGLAWCWSQLVFVAPCRSTSFSLFSVKTGTTLSLYCVPGMICVVKRLVGVNFLTVRFRVPVAVEALTLAFRIRLFFVWDKLDASAILWKKTKGKNKLR